MIKVTKNQSNSAIVSAGHNRLAELLQLPTKCRCNNLQNRFATTYKNILQFYAKSTCKKQKEYYFEELPITQIAEKHGISVEAAYKRVYRSLDRLKKIFMKQEEI